jgi:hypothetical protein
MHTIKVNISKAKPICALNIQNGFVPDSLGIQISAWSDGDIPTARLARSAH